MRGRSQEFRSCRSSEYSKWRSGVSNREIGDSFLKMTAYLFLVNPLPHSATPELLQLLNSFGNYVPV
jgi:hypothetical protein